MMKKLLLSFALLFAPIRVQSTLPNSLTEITRPYLGVYECEQLLIDGEDCLDDFKYIKIQLQTGGQMSVEFVDKQGKKGKLSAEYEYDERTQLLSVYSVVGTKKIKRSFPLKNGEIYVHIHYEVKTLTMKFVQCG